MTTAQRVSEDQRRQMIADAAHFRAERRCFNGGDAAADWLEAEAQIDARWRDVGATVLLEELDERLALGEHASEQAKAQADEISHEISEVIERVSSQRDPSTPDGDGQQR